MKAVLLLEDNAERILEFERATKLLGPEYSLKVWPDAQTMAAECEECLEAAALISLDHLVWREADGMVRRHCLAKHVIRGFVARLGRRYEALFGFTVMD